jgi:hypothetical protein
MSDGADDATTAFQRDSSLMDVRGIDRVLVLPVVLVVIVELV